MKTSSIIKPARSCGVIAAVALLAASSMVATAGEKPSQQDNKTTKLTAQRIELPAMNGMASSVTVWVPKTTKQDVKPAATPTDKVAKVISVPAPNAVNPSIAVWIGR